MTPRARNQGDTAPDEQPTDEQAAAEAEGQDAPSAPAQDVALPHSQGGTTTKDDKTDVGVPMLPGDPSEPVGPEDALGVGPKRGDYRDRIRTNSHVESAPNPNAGDPIKVDGETVDYEPASVMVNQQPRAEDIGEVAGEKGGVTTG